MSVTCPTQLTLLDPVTLVRIGGVFKPHNASLSSFLQHPVIFFVLSPSTFFHNFFQTFLMYVIPSVWDTQALHLYIRVGKIIVLWI